MIALLRSPRFLEARRFASAFSSRFSSTILSFLVLVAVSHRLPVEEYGLYVFLFSIGSAAGLIAVLGQQILVVKHYGRDAPTGDPTNRALLRTNAGWLAFGCGALLAVALLAFILAPRMPEQYGCLWLAFLFAAVFAISEYLQNYFRIHGQINLSLVPREIVWRSASALAIVVASYAGLLPDGETAMGLVTLLLAATTLYQAVRFWQGEGLAWMHRPTGATAALAAGWRTESFYFIANNALNSCSAYLETIVIGALLGLGEAGFYFVALRIAMLLTLPVAAIDTVGIPMIAARFQASDTPGAQRLIGRLSFASFGISLAGAAGLALVAPFVLRFFNPEFVQHSDVLAVLCALSVSAAFFGPGSWLLMIGGGERFFLIARASLFIVYLGLLYWFGRSYGLMGIAVSGVLFNGLSNLAAALWIGRNWQIDNMATAFFKPFLFTHARYGRLGRTPMEPAE